MNERTFLIIMMVMVMMVMMVMVMSIGIPWESAQL